MKRTSETTDLALGASMSAVLLGLPMPNPKRRREITESLELLSTTQGLPTPPTPFEIIQTAMMLSKCVTEYHASLSPVAGEGLRSFHSMPINPFIHTPELLKTLGVDLYRTGTLCDAPIIEGSSITKTQVNGILPRQMAFNGIIIEPAATRIVYVNPATKISCYYCKRESGSCSMLAMVEENGAVCCHPLVDDSVSWADPHPFKATSLPDDHRGTKLRQGSGVCIGCLYNEVLLKDIQFLVHTNEWLTFSKMIMDNYDELPGTRRLCSCRIDDTSVICLCTLSFITHIPAQNTTDDLIIRRMLPPPTLEDYAEQKGFATLDPSPEVIKGVHDMFGFLATHDACNPDSVKRVIMEHSEAQRLVLQTTAVVREVQTLTQHVGTLGKRLEAAMPPSPPPHSAVENPALLNDPQQALQYAIQMQPEMAKYHQAMKTLNRAYGSKVMLMREGPWQEIPICDSCGGIGHTTKKKCPIMTDVEMTTRDSRTLGEHFAQNIAGYFEDQEVGIDKMLDLERWQNERFVQLCHEYHQRMAAAQPAVRHGPSFHFLYNGGPSNRARAKKQEKITPSIPFADLAELKPEKIYERIAIQLFLDADALDEIKRMWDSRGVDTSDFALYKEWLNYATAQGIDRSTVNVKQKVDELLRFARWRIHNNGQTIPTPAVPTTAGEPPQHPAETDGEAEGDGEEGDSDALAGSDTRLSTAQTAAAGRGKSSATGKKQQRASGPSKKKNVGQTLIVDELHGLAPLAASAQSDMGFIIGDDT